jgi:transposase-like protein
MPRPHPPEFRARAIELAREQTKPMAALALAAAARSHAW